MQGRVELVNPRPPHSAEWAPVAPLTRPRGWLRRLLHLLIMQDIVGEIGHEATYLILAVATAERNGVATLAPGALMAAAGLRNDTHLACIRAKAIEAGWLLHEPGHRGRLGRYQVRVPARLADLLPCSMRPREASRHAV